MPRVAGCDPGTSSLDMCVLDDGELVAQVRFEPDALRKQPHAPVAWLRSHAPLDLIAGPSGYGLPLVHAADCTDGQLALMSLVRPDERRAKGVGGFTRVARAFRDSGLPVVFLPGVIHLSTVPPHRKLNRIDLGTPDKLCVAAVMLATDTRRDSSPRTRRLAVVEVGSAFTSCLLASNGAIIDGVGGTTGPIGGRSGGMWDGELAYLLGPLKKADLFAGGLADADPAVGRAALVEAVAKAILGFRVAMPRGYGLRPNEVHLSGSLLAADPGLKRELIRGLRTHLVTSVKELRPAFRGAWVKHAAQGAAIIADGLAGGRFKPVVRRLRLNEASGTVLDWITHPRGADVRTAFGIGS